jgi:hypothetical protein
MMIIKSKVQCECNYNGLTCSEADIGDHDSISPTIKERVQSEKDGHSTCSLRILHWR